MSERSLNAREQRVMDHILQALEEWIDGAEDDESDATLLTMFRVGGTERRYVFGFADGSHVTATLDVCTEAES